MLRPTPDVIVFGDEDGIAEACVELGVRHVPRVERNEFGTPLLNDVFAKVDKLAKFPLRCYANADIILTADFTKAVQRAAGSGQPFLMSGGRSGLDVTAPLDFRCEDWEERVIAAAKAQAQFSFWGNDYFVFTPGIYGVVPPLAIGRAMFDAWFFEAAKAVGAKIIDASKAITAVHQNHDYRHTPTGDVNGVFIGPEADHNTAFVGSGRQWFLMDATHELTDKGLHRVWGRKLRVRAREILIYKTGTVRKAVGLNRAGLRKLADICGLAAEQAGSRRDV